MQNFPQIDLDTTMAELYAQDKSNRSNGRIAMVLCAPNSGLAPTSKLARNVKFLYQDRVFNMTSDDTSFLASDER